MPLPVTQGELRGGFRRLGAAADATDGEASHLLRFYSVECGLKAALLRRSGLRTTAQLPKDLLTHDLRRLAVELRLSPAASRALLACRRRGDPPGRPPVDVGQLHEAWRYGASLDVRDEQRSVAGLTSLQQWCRDEIGR